MGRQSKAKQKAAQSRAIMQQKKQQLGPNQEFQKQSETTILSVRPDVSCHRKRPLLAFRLVAGAATVPNYIE